MSEESAGERIERREALAYEAGQRRAVVDSRLDSHEARLAAINGSIEKHARNADALRQSIDALRDQLDRISATIDKRAAIEADRVNQLKKANDSQISTRMFFLGVAAIMVTILAAFISSGHLG